MNQRLRNKYLPMTETAYYILLSLRIERHGYAVMQHVESLTGGRLKLGAGTVYGTLKKMEADGVIQSVSQHDRRKTYRQTPTGKDLLDTETTRLEEMLGNGRREMGATS
jgi:DNA-binding PadR family transcriptional regulator